MQNLKKNWEITQNWQLIFIALGIVGLLASAYFVSLRLMPSTFKDIGYEYAFSILATLFLSFVFYKITMWLFKRLYKRWGVTYRWELIAIFIVFAITGSLSARLSVPFMQFLGLSKETLSPWIFWPLRILILFPIYQVLLIVMGWIFGQFAFFWEFEKKMLSRFGIKL
jgi:hypothetical protein